MSNELLDCIPWPYTPRRPHRNDAYTHRAFVRRVSLARPPNHPPRLLVTLEDVQWDLREVEQSEANRRRAATWAVRQQLLAPAHDVRIPIAGGGPAPLPPVAPAPGLPSEAGAGAPDGEV